MEQPYYKSELERILEEADISGATKEYIINEFIAILMQRTVTMLGKVSVELIEDENEARAFIAIKLAESVEKIILSNPKMISKIVDETSKENCWVIPITLFRNL